MKFLFKNNLDYTKLTKICEEKISTGPYNERDVDGYDFRKSTVNKIILDRMIRENKGWNNDYPLNFVKINEITSNNGYSLVFNGLEIKMPKGRFAFEHDNLPFCQVLLYGNCTVTYYHIINEISPTKCLCFLPINEYYIIMGDTFTKVSNGDISFSIRNCIYHDGVYGKEFTPGNVQKAVECGIFEIMSDEKQSFINFSMFANCRFTSVSRNFNMTIGKCLVIV